LIATDKVKGNNVIATTRKLGGACKQLCCINLTGTLWKGELFSRINVRQRNIYYQIIQYNEVRSQEGIEFRKFSMAESL